jgi:hypothetical protein
LRDSINFKRFFQLKNFGIFRKRIIFAISKNGTIAQLVEQRTENPCVPGSIPGGTTQKKEMPSTQCCGHFF